MRKRKANFGWAQVKEDVVKETGKKVLHVWLPECAGMVSIYSSGHVHLEADEVEKFDRNFNLKPVRVEKGGKLCIRLSSLFFSFHHKPESPAPGGESRR